MKLIGRIRCLFRPHKRSHSRARQVEGVYHSVCRHCGTAMYRDRDRNWRVTR
ncbi:hypothetical protein ACFQ1E_16110 [Sphingomonas canadensis]|uniref:Uncharacterized protein n=1 Tax=Sphingomonas canadensis TaxID=1219257 RepID=A0ABW3HCD3_9SPHN|nr:hypothetical protein [Sphingomonas canadensis]MCW3837570.1 hypothetical protein [Sphingomonas canadensis]